MHGLRLSVLSRAPKRHSFASHPLYHRIRDLTHVDLAFPPNPHTCGFVVAFGHRHRFPLRYSFSSFDHSRSKTASRATFAGHDWIPCKPSAGTSARECDKDASAGWSISPRNCRAGADSGQRDWRAVGDVGRIGGRGRFGGRETRRRTAGRCQVPLTRRMRVVPHF